MPWKKDENGAFVTDDKGNPIFTLDSGEERSVDYPAMSTALTEASRESAKRKDTIRQLETAAQAWKDIEDIPGFIATARKDADAVKAMGDKERTAEEAARARVQAATAPLEKEIADLKADRARVIEQFHTSTIHSQFGTSKYVLEELVSPAMAQELYAKHFSVGENGEIVGKDSAGNVIYDEKGPAGFEFALRQIVSASPYKSFVTKGSDKSGSGSASGVPNGGAGGVKTMRRADFEKLNPVDRMARMKEGYKIVD